MYLNVLIAQPQLKLILEICFALPFCYSAELSHVFSGGFGWTVHEDGGEKHTDNPAPHRRSDPRGQFSRHHQHPDLIRSDPPAYARIHTCHGGGLIVY